jgi:D-alanyl-D-alanine carboxypeptidase
MTRTRFGFAALATALVLVVVLVGAMSSHGAAQTRDPAKIAAAVDARVANALRGGLVAGMSVAMMLGSDTLLYRTYGRADLELDVPTPDRAVYEIASVTKQFTAAAILILQEQGKLSLDDELTKFLPNYPTQGHRVTLRHLLTHTSGIRGFHTYHPEFKAIVAQSLPRDSLVAIYARKPFDFAPGSKELYNNTAYVLLGQVVEKVSGMSYESFVKQHLFDRAGMRDSGYCSNPEIAPRRVRGYNSENRVLQPLVYMDHRWGFSLCSTAGDLVAWTQALHSGKILGPAAYEEMIAPGILNDGTKLSYAKGLQFLSLAGHRAIAHGGALPGFSAAVAYLPDDSVTIVVLMNSRGDFSPYDVARTLVRTVLGAR